ncbi:MAG: hypothetical protein WCP70_07270 [Methanothrix sp.]
MILILGSTGETGSWFARYFKEKGFNVVVKAGRCNEKTPCGFCGLLSLRLSGLRGASNSRCLVSCSCGTTKLCFHG